MEHITASPIGEQALLDRVRRSEAGALLTFAGVVRDHHRGRKVLAIDYHAYEPMAAREIRKIEIEISRRWNGVHAAILHRTGHLEVGEVSVLIAVSSPHREEGFQVLRHAIDTLKSRVPIWKKEIYEDGHAWIEGS